MILQNPVDGPRIVPYRENRLPTDVLPNGHAGFRVTQTFASTEGYYKGVPHGALDVGNFTCGDRVLAAADGLCQAGKDSAGALRIIQDIGGGWKILYWHLNGWVDPVRFGAGWVPVKQGQQIGIVGDTGLGAVCHLHFEVHYSGIKRDPWPLLAQNQEYSMEIRGKFVRHIINRRTATRVAANFREGPTGKDAIINTFGAGTALYPVVEVEGELVGSSAQWFGAWLYSGGWKFGYFHSSGLGAFVAHEATGITEQEVADKVEAAVTAALSEAIRLGADAIAAMRRLIPS